MTTTLSLTLRALGTDNVFGGISFFVCDTIR
jgi:hypothetical protein